MSYNVLTYLERSASAFPEKSAVTDDNGTITYSELLSECKRIGTALADRGIVNEPVGVYMEKSIDAVKAFFGIVYAGGFYSMLNNELTDNRLESIESVLSPAVIITTQELMPAAERIFKKTELVDIEELMKTGVDENRLASIRAKHVDTDPLYVNFTSGSTGTPKGIVVGHRSVIDFIECFTETFGIGQEDIIANQAPFDFDVSVKDIYSSICTGATLAIVPRRLFSAPVELIDFLCDNKVTTMIWAVSALCLISTFHGLDYRTPETVNKILFSGEVMPYKRLMDFLKHLPDAVYVNLYGPTEITCNCTYHILERDRDYSEGIPIGKPFPNEDVFLLDENNNRVEKAGQVGEVCVRGTALALGYYDCPEQNEAHFVQNPLNTHYPELIYRTGDLAYYSEAGELFFSGRKDFQIKYMGHRIEMEEIERAMMNVPGVERCCCIFDEKKSRLKGYYVGDIGKEEVHRLMSDGLPAFMIPGIIRQVEDMPLTKNGKIDRKKLEEMVTR